MRLTPPQITAIKELAQECFGEGTAVYLFGSRVDDHRRGGDIDLCVETYESDIARVLDAKICFLAKLKLRIGDQRIDVVVNYPTRRRPPPIIDVAKRTGIRL